MKYCNICKLVIENDLNDCPLCKHKTLKHNAPAEKDFPSQNIIREDTTRTIIKVLLFLFITLIGTNVVLNLTFSFKMIWAPYFIVVLFYAYLLIRVAMKSYKNIGTIVMMNVYMLSIMGFILDMFLGYQGWSINYLIPFVVLAGICALTIFIMVKPTFFLEYFVYMLIIASFGIMLLVLLWCGLVTVKLPSIITAFISLLSIIGMFIFGDNSAKNEFIKRFHF